MYKNTVDIDAKKIFFVELIKVIIMVFNDLLFLNDSSCYNYQVVIQNFGTLLEYVVSQKSVAAEAEKLKSRQNTKFNYYEKNYFFSS